MSLEDRKKCILVCGGGNGAHCLTALVANRPNTEVRVLTLFADEAERWTKILETSNLTVSIHYSDGHTGKHDAKPAFVTKDPAVAVPGADIIVLTVPAFAHEQYFTEISKHVNDNTLIIGLPGQAGFEIQCSKLLGEKAQTCAIMSLESLPWACRIVEFGKLVELLGFKEALGAALIMGSRCTLPDPAVDIIQWILGEKPVVKLIPNYVAINLMAKSIVHPPMMYGQWKDWDGQPMDAKPLFYQGIDDLQAGLLSTVSDEVVNTAKEFEKKRPGVDMSDVIHIYDWYKTYYTDDITDMSCLKRAMQTNKAYDGLVHPMKAVENNKFVPDFKYRYLSEDIPYGLVIMKGIAEIAGVKTPCIDEVIHWGQKIMGKEYLVGSELKGKDVNSTRAPQRFGIKTIDELFKIQENKPL